MKVVEFVFGAESDLQNLFNQLEDQQEGLGTEFILAADAHLTRITHRLLRSIKWKYADR